MSADTYTEVTRRGWGSRIGGSIKGIFGGLIMVLLGIVLMWWNEGRAVQTARSLEEGAGVVVSVSPGLVNASNEGKLVHMTGEARSNETLTDPDFGISTVAIALKREVEMFQWVESSHSETRKKLGGSEETVTTYSYDRKWTDRPIDSGSFKKPDGHANPGSFPFSEQTWRSQQVGLGSFTLSPGLAEQMSAFQVLPVTATSGVRRPGGSSQAMHLAGNGLYLGRDPSNPQVGDVRVTFKQVLPATVSIVAQQDRQSFRPYHAKAGDDIEMLKLGAFTADAMFKAAISSNTMLTWLLRLVGFVLVFAGLAAVFKPLSVLGDVVPFVGNLIGMGTGIVAFLLALVISLVVLALAWLFYRPLLGIGLLVAAVVGVVLLVRRKRARAAAPAEPPPLPRV